MRPLRPFIHRLKVPLQSTGQEARVTLPWPVSWVTIGSESGVAQGYIVSNCSNALKYGMYFYTNNRERRFEGPWYGQDLYIAPATAGQLYLNIWAFPVKWFGAQLVTDAVELHDDDQEDDL